MEYYDYILLEIERIKNEPTTPNRNVSITLIKTLIRGLAIPIRARKLKLKHNIETEGFDYSLLSFFGNDDIKDHEKKLKDHEKKLGKLAQKTKQIKQFEFKLIVISNLKLSKKEKLNGNM